MLPLLWKRLMGGKKEAAPHRFVQGWVSQNGYGSYDPVCQKTSLNVIAAD